MTHHIVHIKASPKQLSKLRNGHKVRINPAMEGEGVNLIIHPQTYSIVSRSFGRGKGVQVQLSPEEISVNRDHSGTLQGTGIFGKKFDDWVDKTFGSKTKDAVYNAADELKPAIKRGIARAVEYAPEAGATALSALATASGNPELIPLAAAFGHQAGRYAGERAGRFAEDYLDHPGKYQRESNAGGPRNPVAPTLQGQAQHNEELTKMNQELGTQYGALSRAGMHNAKAHRHRAQMEADTVEHQLFGGGLHRRREVASVGKMASMVGSQTHLPPALMSQPFSANFQFQHFLPPAYQKFSKGGGLYA